MDDFETMPKMAGWHDANVVTPRSIVPTNKLRFVERVAELSPFYKSVNDKGQIVPAPQKVRILQQWWEDTTHDVHWLNGAPGEWRDIPIEEEK